MGCRMVQNKHIAYSLLGLALAVVFMFLRVERELRNLQQTKQRLESLIASHTSGVHYSVEPSLAKINVGLNTEIIIYNRVPKTASTTFAGMAYELCGPNHFHVIHFNVTRNSHILSITDQMRFIKNITEWEARKPTMYHGHIAYIDFSRLGALYRPTYINILRDPIERLVSYYYFVRHGDDFRPNVRRRKSGDKQSFDECVEQRGNDCSPSQLWSQIPFFCGHAAECLIPGSAWALQQAKFNLVNNYLVVGITEELEDFFNVLEATLPRFFRGITALYTTGHKSHLRKTYNKEQPSQDSIQQIQQSHIWKLENEFYVFARDQFHFIKRKLFYQKNGVLKERSPQFQYEKIRPR